MYSSNGYIYYSIHKINGKNFNLFLFIYLITLDNINTICINNTQIHNWQNAIKIIK